LYYGVDLTIIKEAIQYNETLKDENKKNWF
jgi:hypothetical protein